MIDYSSAVNVSVLLQDGVHVQKNLKDALIFLESQLMQYAQWGKIDTINNVFYNYINNIYPVLELNV